MSIDVCGIRYTGIGRPLTVRWSSVLCVWDKTLPQPLLNREFERRPDYGVMVARDT